VPFIHLILPNAVIIDARRHPMSCCFSNFKQHFARGQAFSYSLDDMGRYYADYVRLMAHIDNVLPNRVHRVIYENMVDDTEAETRALLAACGLDFEPACLEFHKTERAVRTASSEQVRQPIFRDGTEGWQAFEPYLSLLKSALGNILTSYPAASQ
jgi:Sulfotransferase family